MPVSIVKDQLEMMAKAEGLEVLVQSTNLLYRVMGGVWVCVGTGPTSPA